jgi:2',3'-cyclic-nucleotide 2'-phosphodiesterase (5'-nucleotidase family)
MPATRRLASRPLAAVLGALALASGLCWAELRSAAAAERLTVTLLQTSDLHAHVFPHDYFTGEPAEHGLAKVATLVGQIRAQTPEAVLLDAGDTIQGTPLAYYHYRVEPTDENPVISAMNLTGYDAMTVGNHEFNFGPEILGRAQGQSKFPWLSANILGPDGQPAFKPYLVLERGGVRIGVLGLTTRNIPNWEKPEHIEGLSFTDALEAARRFVPLLREKLYCDLVVVLTHQGFERDLDTGEPNQTDAENQAYAIAAEVPGIDVLLAGHSHRNIEPRMLGDTLVSMPYRYGARLTRVDVVLERGEDGRLGVVSREGKNLDVAGLEPDPTVLGAARPFHERTLAYVDSQIGTLTATMDGRRARVGDSAMLDLLHDVQMHYTGARLSLASMLPYQPPVFEAGPITIRDIYAFYLYDNTLYSIEVTGQQIKDALEVSASYYEGARLSEGGQLLLGTSRTVRPYNFDTLAGASYQIDPTRPVGERIVHLTMDGRPMDLEARHLLAVNNYRAAGSAGYDMFKHAPRRYVSSEEIRELMIEYIQKMKVIEPKCDHNWFVAPVAELETGARR